jgi:hypothetical protein
MKPNIPGTLRAASFTGNPSKIAFAIQKKPSTKRAFSAWAKKWNAL